MLSRRIVLMVRPYRNNMRDVKCLEGSCTYKKRGEKASKVVWKLQNIRAHESQRPTSYLRTCAPSEESDQPAHSRSLIRVSTGLIIDRHGCKVSSCGRGRLIRLHGCAGWSESSLCAYVKRYAFWRFGSNVQNCVPVLVVNGVLQEN